MSEKIWYIKLNYLEEGPYSFEELRQDLRITPDTLARKKNYPLWRPIRKIPELRKLFFDDDTSEEEFSTVKIKPQDELVLEMNRDPRFNFWIIILVLILVLYIIYLIK